MLPGDYLDGQIESMIGEELEAVEKDETSRRGEGETDCGP